MENTTAKPVRPKTLKRWLKSTSNRSFAFYPVLVFLFEFLIHRTPFYWWGWNVLVGVPFLIWGYGQYRLAGNYRTRIGGGGPGIDVPPTRIVEQGIYAYTRNPMYLGHIIYMIGVALVFQSWFAAALAAARTVWFHFRVLKDERGLEARFGEPYLEYKRRVKRWIFGLF